MSQYEIIQLDTTISPEMADAIKKFESWIKEHWKDGNTIDEAKP